jgi:hypothetical protein
MDLSNHNRALLRGLLAAAVVLASASACSRSDRTDTGRDNTGAISLDSSGTQPANSAVTPPSADSASISSDTGTNSGAGAAAVRRPMPRSNTNTPQRSIRDSSAAGYRSMERDTITEPSTLRDTARATTDSTLAPAGQSSVTPSDSAPMEVATSTAADTLVSSQDVAVHDSASGEAAATPGDSSVEMAGAASPATNDTAAAQDMSADTTAAGYAEMAQDTSAAPAQADSGVAIEARVDTANTDSTAMENGDASRIHTDSTAVASADSVTESERIRPPEDSTETLGAVTTDETASADRTDEVGAAAISSGNVNAADAVALMTRQGAQCIVVDPETAQGVEMSDTPTTINPCGLGSMVLSRIWTKKE